PTNCFVTVFGRATLCGAASKARCFLSRQASPPARQSLALPKTFALFTTNPHFRPEFAQRNLQVATNENVQSLFPRHRPGTAFDNTTILDRAKLLALLGRVVIQDNHYLARVAARYQVKILLMSGHRWREPLLL